jgi:hypothetical protein
MMDTLTPRPGFDWSRVKWSRYVQYECSYCGDAIPEDTVPLRLTDEKSNLGAVFCDHCMAAWWGMRSYDDPVEPQHEPEVLANREGKANGDQERNA